MTTSILDVFKVGLGPSSSHTVGPMRAARMFAMELVERALLQDVARVHITLHGSLAATGRGHATDAAVVLGLLGHRPEVIDPGDVARELAGMRASGTVLLLGRHQVGFDERRDLSWVDAPLPRHPNGMWFRAIGAGGDLLAAKTYYSVGGGFVEDGDATAIEDETTETQCHPYRTAAELLAHAASTGSSISAVALANEGAFRPPSDTVERLLGIWHTMHGCINRGLSTEGILPGGLHVVRRAPALHRKLLAQPDSDPLRAMDWVSLDAIAVNEENAAGGRVVTAPTNGAAGILPAVLHHYVRAVPDADDAGIVRFLLAAGAVGLVFIRTASVSGAEVGCQGEVGAACSMAAAGLAEVLGGSPAQVENAAEIALEHNLGLTCDPVGGLVQVPCIERNAIGAIKAIGAARLALQGDGTHLVSLDRAIATMRQTGADMKSEYKETSRGGLAVNVVEC